MTLKTYEKINLGGKDRILKFDYNAISDLEETTGKGYLYLLGETQLGMHTLRMFYWAGLKWNEKGITPQVIGKYLQQKLEDGDTFETLFEPIVKSLQRVKLLPKEEDLDEMEYHEAEVEVEVKETKGKSKN